MRHAIIMLCFVVGFVAACSGKPASSEKSGATDDPSHSPEGTNQGTELSQFQKDLKALMSEAQYKGVCDRCMQLSDALQANPGVKPFCDAQVEKAIQLWEAALVKHRDSGGEYDAKTRLSCGQLQQQLTSIEPERSDRIATLCQELALNDDIVQVRKALALALKSERPQMPALCDTTIAECKKLGSSYALEQSKSLAEACHQTFPRDAVKVLMATLAAGGETVDEKTLQRCFDLQQLAARLSAKEAKEATAFCSEIQAMGKVRQALADAQRNMKNSTHRIPRSCGMAVMALAGMRSQSAKSSRSRVIDVCYVQLGSGILAAKLPTMEFGCDPTVRSVVDAAKNHQIKDEKLLMWVKKALPKCGAR